MRRSIVTGDNGGPSILVVDDDEQIGGLLVRMLEPHGYRCVVTSDPAEARDRLIGGQFALLLTDILMPGESGLSLAKYVTAQHQDTAVIMVTVLGDPRIAQSALEVGAYGYIVKPFQPDEVLITVAGALHRRSLEIENRRHREHLSQLVQERTAELQGTLARVRAAEAETIHRLCRAAEFRDRDTGAHIERMGRHCGLLARRAGLGAQLSELIELASPMHDIGKIAVPDHILFKPGKLTPEEFEVIKRHPEVGYKILADSEGAALAMGARIALTHHEKWDGSGYPRGLAGDAIPIEGRIAAVADVLDALLSERVYKPAYPPELALEIMRDGRGRHFDPDLLDTFSDSWEEFLWLEESLSGSSRV